MTQEHGDAVHESDAAPEDPIPPRRLPPLRGCLVRGLAVIVAAIVLAVVIGETFDQGKQADAPPQGFNAGLAEGYPRGDVSDGFVDSEHVFIVRFPDGTFRAYYDRSSKRQELGGDCRIEYDETALPGRLEQVTGMRGAFVEECEGVRAVWRVDGRLATTSSYGDLNRFETRITDGGELFVDTSERNCTRSVGVPGIEPFEEKTCGGAP